MQLVIFSEDHPQGQTAEWPVIPRKGDIITRSSQYGETNQVVEQVRWHINPDGSFHSAEIHLVY
jgi:hypothetical protein